MLLFDDVKVSSSFPLEILFIIIAILRRHRHREGLEAPFVRVQQDFQLGVGTLEIPEVYECMGAVIEEVGREGCRRPRQKAKIKEYPQPVARCRALKLDLDPDRQEQLPAF